MIRDLIDQGTRIYIKPEKFKLNETTRNWLRNTHSIDVNLNYDRKLIIVRNATNSRV